MNEENRQDIRFEEIGRVLAPDLCAIPGVLDDISLTGCKIHFPCLFQIDMENEYKLNISLTSPNSAPLQLISKPIWAKEFSDVMEIGFQFLFSPDDARLRELIVTLKEKGQDEFPVII